MNEAVENSSNSKSAKKESFSMRMSSFLSTPMRLIDDSRLRASLERCVLARVIIVSVLLAVSAKDVLFGNSSVQETWTVFLVLGLTYFASLGNIFILERTKRLISFAYGQGILDVVLASLVIYVTGGTTSPFIFLYLLIIAGAASLLSSHGAVVVAAFSGLCYAVLASGIVPSADGVPTEASTPEIFGVYVALVTIALLSGYLARQIEDVRGIARQHERSVNELTLQQRQLFDDLSEGIITLNLEHVIESVNKAACAILGLHSRDAEQLIGRAIDPMLERFGVSDFSNMINSALTRHDPVEVCLKALGSDEELCISYTARSMVNASGDTTGSIVLFNDVSHLKSIENRLSLHEEMTKLLSEVPQVNEVVRQRMDAVQMIGESQVMNQVLTLVERVAASDAAVLVTGESGTGKELIAKSIHAGSIRSSKPFIAINCGAIPENLIESELFGHKRGAFTGADSDNPGLFRQANGGSIFLDEVGELPLHLQSKLLRVLQEKMVRGVGDVRDVPVDVRVLSATNRDLKKEIAANNFREDLFYRLNVVNIVVPPLRDRKEDIPLLVRYFISKYSEPNKVLPKISPEALEMLMAYPFPGNIRELENVIERAIVLGGQAILAEHFPTEVRDRRSYPPINGTGSFPVLTNTNGAAPRKMKLPVDLEGELSTIEQRYLRRALEESGGVKKAAAELLGLNFRSFRYRLKKYGLSDSDN